MFDPDPSDLAVRGERGIDLFQRLGDVSQKRARYRCIGTVSEGATPRLSDFEPQARRDPQVLIGRAQTALQDPVLAASMALGDTTTWPSARDAADPVALFLQLDFFRAWQVADLAIRRLHDQLTQDADSLPIEPNRVAGAIVPLFDFNRLSRGLALAALIEPVLRRRTAQPGFRDDPASSTGYALRMLGDLCLRAGDPARAYACFDTAIGAGDNPYRRRKAIEAAHLAGDHAALGSQIAAFRRQWVLPADLAALDTEASA